VEKRNANKELVGKYDFKKPHAMPRNRWENNFKIYLECV
jgi:hypothetical protein